MYRIRLWNPDEIDGHWMLNALTGEPAEFETADEAAPYLQSAKEIHADAKLVKMNRNLQPFDQEI